MHFTLGSQRLGCLLDQVCGAGELGRDCTALAALAALAATDCATEESILVVSAAAGSATLWATMAAASTDAPKR